MSTRGWYDYYVIAPDTGMLSLAMRFYKWGDGTPVNAREEYVLFQGRLHQHSNRLPVEWLDRLLREQLGNLHARRPPHFAARGGSQSWTGAFHPCTHGSKALVAAAGERYGAGQQRGRLRIRTCQATCSKR